MKFWYIIPRKFIPNWNKFLIKASNPNWDINNITGVFKLFGSVEYEVYPTREGDLVLSVDLDPTRKTKMSPSEFEANFYRDVVTEETP